MTCRKTGVGFALAFNGIAALVGCVIETKPAEQPRIALIRNHLKASDWHSREQAFLHLQQDLDSAIELVDELERLLRDGTWLDRYYAAHLCYTLDTHAEATVPVLMTLLQTPVPADTGPPPRGSTKSPGLSYTPPDEWSHGESIRQAKIQIVQAVGRFAVRRDDAKAALLACAADPDPWVAETVARAIGLLPPAPDTLRALEELSLRTEPLVRHNAVWGLLSTARTLAKTISVGGGEGRRGHAPLANTLLAILRRLRPELDPWLASYLSAEDRVRIGTFETVIQALENALRGE